MKRPSDAFILFFIIIFALLILNGCKKQEKGLALIFSNLEISMNGFEDFVLDDEDGRIAAHDNTTIFTIFPIKSLKAEQAKEFVDEKTTILEAQYEIRDAPYPGEITKNIVCKEEFKPVKNAVINKFSMASYKLYSTKSLTYGICVNDLITYKAFLGFFYCDGKGLFQIEAFVPIENEMKFDEVLQKVSTLNC